MSTNQLKLKQLENALLTINQAKFQDLVNHFLFLKGYNFIAAPGSVIGKEKTSKGQPDSFYLDGDKYIFVEITTKERLGNSKSFFNKILEDVKNCFDFSKTNVEVKEISKIILAFTDKLSTSEFSDVKKLIQSFNENTELETLNIQNFPLNILDFPRLGNEYLGITLIEGEIYNLTDFLIKTNNGLQPSLSNQFLGREEEINIAKDYLKTNDILLLSGSSGVGKSKMGVKLLQDFESDEYTPIVILSSMVPLWNDFVNLFQNDKKYIILFDDANKSLQNLIYLLDFISKAKPFTIKLVITVRDYVKQGIKEKLKEKFFKELIIENFKDSEIEKIILNVLPNLKYHNDIKEKIILIAKGNARVALMATNSVVPNSEINYLANPVTLYERYFNKIASEAKIFEKPIILQTLAIVSFFGVLEKSDTELQNVLQREFNIDWDLLWDTIIELHIFELLDVYENEIVKVSDQVLSTYAFYQCFLNEHKAVIDYGKWISIFINKYGKKLTNSLTDVNNTFGYYHIKELALSHLNYASLQIKDDETLYKFYYQFWFYKPQDALLYLKNWTDNLPKETSSTVVNFNYVHNDHTYAKKYIEILINFWNSPNEFLKPSLEIALELVYKQNSKLPEILKFLNDYFTFKWLDLHNDFCRQNILIDMLIAEEIDKDKKHIKNGIFLKITQILLGWHFTEYIGAKGMAINIRNFNLNRTEELLTLRSKILNKFIELYNFNQEASEEILMKIVRPNGDIDKLIYKDELTVYENLVNINFNNSNYSQCKFIKRLSNLLAETETIYPKKWGAFLDAEILKLAKFLKIEFDDEKGKSLEDRRKEKIEEHHKFVNSNPISKIKLKLDSIENLVSQLKDNSLFFIEDAVTEIFIAAAKKNVVEFKELLIDYFVKPIKLPLNNRLLNNILSDRVCDTKFLLDIVDANAKETKQFWVISILTYIPEYEITVDFVKLLIETFENSIYQLPLWEMRTFNKYSKAFAICKMESEELKETNHNIISLLTEILLSKKDKYRVHLGWEFCHSCKEFFVENVELFKKAYLHQKVTNHHFDYESKELNSVLELDNNFLFELISQRLSVEQYPSYRDDDFKLDYVWELENHPKIINEAIELIIEKVPIFSNFEHYANVLFRVRKKDEHFLLKAEDFIKHFISLNYDKKEHILIIINVIQHRFQNKFIEFLKQLFILNQDIELFKSMYLSNFGCYSGSRVPHIQLEIDLCNEILIMIKTLPNILNYVNHINYLEQMIIWLKKDIINEQKREFRDNYD